MEELEITTATLSERGQVTIPKQFRTKLGFTPGTVLVFAAKGNTLTVRAKKKRNPFKEAYGCLKGAFGGLSTDEIIREMRGC